MSPVINGVAQPGIVEELYISGNEVVFRNYSVNNTLSLGLTAPVSVKWGVKDNHFFVQTGTGASAVFRIYTLDRAAEGVIYQPGIIPTATLVKTLPMAALNVTVCTATFNVTQRSSAMSVNEDRAPDGSITGYTTRSLERDVTVTPKVTTFILDAALLSAPNAFGGVGAVSATVDLANATLDGDLNLLLAFTLTWADWNPFVDGDPLEDATVEVLADSTPPPCAIVLTTDGKPHLGSFLFNERHVVISNLGTNNVIYSTLPTTLSRLVAFTGQQLNVLADGSLSMSFPQSQTSEIPFPPLTCQSTPISGTFALGDIGVNGKTTNESLLYLTLPFVSLATTFEAVDTSDSQPTGVTANWIRRLVTQRWRIETTVVPLTGRRSSGSISGNLIAAVLKVSQVPTNAIAAWAADVQKDGWFLLRGSGLVFSTTLRAMQASAPTVTIQSFNERYLLWSIPGFVYRTTLTTGDTVEVSTDLTQFTGRQLTLINPIYLYSLTETNDDEGTEGHFFVDIESTPLPTTDLPVTDSLVKWDMFNPVDDLKHL